MADLVSTYPLQLLLTALKGVFLIENLQFDVRYRLPRRINRLLMKLWQPDCIITQLAEHHFLDGVCGPFFKITVYYTTLNALLVDFYRGPKIDT